MAWRLAFAGAPPFAATILEQLLESKHRVDLVYTQPPRPTGRGRRVAKSIVHNLAETAGIEVRIPTKLTGEETTLTDFDCLVVAAYGLLLPQSILDAPRHGCLNVHASLLPRWRGAAPVERAIMAGDTETGASIMRIEAKLDAGPVYRQRRLPLDDAAVGATVSDDLATLGAETLLEVLNELPDLSPTPQDDAVATYAHKLTSADALIDCWRISPDDRLLLPLPLFHIHGLGNGLHTWLFAGYRLRLLERFRKETIAQEFLDFRPTVFFGVPTMYERLLDVPPETAREIGSFMRLFVSGSAPLPAATLERFEKLYGHVVLERYGMSETMMNISNPYDGERRPGSVGLPLPGVSIKLDGPENDQTSGETGEVLIKGPNVFAGYWRQPEATKAAFTSSGYFRSGDLAIRSPDGYYTLQGRKTDLIISGGFNIYPREIEEFLNEQPEVGEAAVVGEPDAVKGEAPVAYIVPSEAGPLDGDELCSRCREHLASFKVPRRIVTVEQIPRNALGKIQRHLLK